jgi:hypothetical protein
MASYYTGSTTNPGLEIPSERFTAFEPANEDGVDYLSTLKAVYKKVRSTLLYLVRKPNTMRDISRFIARHIYRFTFLFYLIWGSNVVMMRNVSLGLPPMAPGQIPESLCDSPFIAR